MPHIWKQDIAWLDVAMDHTTPVRILKCRGDLQGDLQNAIEVSCVNLLPMIEIAVPRNRHHKVAALITPILGHVRIDELDDVLGAHPPKDCHLLPEPHYPVPVLQLLKGPFPGKSLGRID